MGEVSPKRRRRSVEFAGLTLVSLALVAGLVYVVGPASLLDRIARADPSLAALALVSGVAALAARHVAFATLYRAADAGPYDARFHLLILLAGIPRWILPVGYVGAPPINAAYLSRGLGAKIGPTIAALTVAQVFVTVGSVFVVSFGVGTAMATGAGSLSGGVVALGGIAGLALASAGVAVVLARSDRTGPTVTRAGRRAVSATRASRPVAWVWTSRPVRAVRTAVTDRIGDRIDRFTDALHAIAADRRSLAIAATAGCAGWVLSVFPLFFSLWAVGDPVAFPVVMVVVPMSAVAGAVPLPAGIGSTEAALSGLLVAVSGGAVSPGAATAAAFLSRFATLGFQMALGALAGVVLLAIGRRTAK
jgi:uncharacterized protein (TIRG00374 family)